MNPALAPYWQTIVAPWRIRANTSTWFGSVFWVLPTLLLGGLIVLIGEFSGTALITGALVFIVLSTQGFWMLHTASTAPLNQPASVLLVPGYLRVQRSALIALWLVLTLIQTGALAGAHALGLTLLAAAPALWLLAFAASLLFWALVIRWPWVVAAIFLMTPLWLQPLAEQVRALNLPWLNVAGLEFYARWWAAPLLAVMAWVLSRTALRPGHAAHRAQVMANAKIGAALDTNHTGGAHRISARASMAIIFLQTPFHRYAAWLLARPGNGPANAMARAELGLGARTHWVMQVTNVGATFAVVGLGALLSRNFGSSTTETLMNPTALLFMGGLVIAPMFTWRTALRQTTKEQALMLLLPGMPRGVALNQALARRHLCHLCIAWLTMTIVILCVPWSEAVNPFAQGLSVLILPLLPLVIQDWSRMQPITGGRGLGLLIKGAVGMPGVLVALYCLQVPVPGIALVSVAGFIVTTAWRWKRLAKFAQAFVVGSNHS
ncbi:MAG: hypothetical protein H7293_17830 [Candidatus Saccharibacteria bacterium]|nr:hypothetical protein [Rhodoferax sp.]